jgi:hypothetical protein
VDVAQLRGRFALGEQELRALRARLELAVLRARRSGEPTLVSGTFALPGDVDPSAVVCASRRPGEPWFALEQPSRGGVALAALGEAIGLSDTGADRFATLADRWRRLAAAAVGGERGSADGHEGAGPLALCGFAFAPDGGRSHAWAGFEPSSLVVPELAIRRRALPGGASDPVAKDPRHGPTDGRAGARVDLTLAALVAPDDVAVDVLERMRRRLAELR